MVPPAALPHRALGPITAIVLEAAGLAWRAAGFTPGQAAGTVASMALTTTAAAVPLRCAARLRPAPALRAE